MGSPNGYSPERAVSETPILINELKNREIMFIGAGEFSACITSRGELLIWGLPNLRRRSLGNSGFDADKQRVVVKYEMKDKISKMSIRGKNAVLLDDKGKVWRLGLDLINTEKTVYGRESIPSLDRDSRILQVSSVEGRRVKSISAGKDFTVAICRGRGEVKYYSPARSDTSAYNISSHKKTVNLEPESYQPTQEFNIKNTNKKRVILTSEEEHRRLKQSEYNVNNDKTSFEYSVSRKDDDLYGKSRITQKSSRGSNESFKVSRRETTVQQEKESPIKQVSRYDSPEQNDIKEIRLIGGKQNVKSLGSNSRSGSEIKQNYGTREAHDINSGNKIGVTDVSRQYQSSNYSRSSNKYENRYERNHQYSSSQRKERTRESSKKDSKRSRSRKLLKTEIARLLGQIHEQDKLLDDTFIKNRELKTENDELRSELVNLRRQMREENIYVNRKVRNEREEMQKLEEKFKVRNVEYQDQIDKLNEDYDMISQKLIQYMEILSKKTEENKKLIQELEIAKEENKEIIQKNQEIEKLESSNRNLLSKTTSLNLETLKLKEEIHKLERKITDKNHDIDEALNKKIMAQEEALKIKKQLSLKEKEIVTIMHKYQAAQSEAEELKIKNKELSRLLDESIYEKSRFASQKYTKYNTNTHNESLLSNKAFLNKTMNEYQSKSSFLNENNRTSKHSSFIHQDSRGSDLMMKTYTYDQNGGIKNIVISDKYTPSEYRLTRKESNFLTPNTPKSPTPINSPTEHLPFKSPTPVNSPPDGENSNNFPLQIGINQSRNNYNNDTSGIINNNGNLNSILRTNSSYNYLIKDYSKEKNYERKRVSYSPDVDVHNFNQGSPPVSRRHKRNMSYDDSIRKRSLEFAKGAQNLLGIFDDYGGSENRRGGRRDEDIDSGIRKVVGRRAKLEEKIREFEAHVLKN